MASVADPMPAAIVQALDLFESEARPTSPRLRDGYLDLLGDDGVEAPHFSHRALQSRVIPAIYERLSRPAVLRLLAGMKAPRRREEHNIALEMLKIADGNRVLDVACGPGNFTRDFAAAAGDGLVVGLDAATPMLAAGVQRTRAGNAAYVRGDACALTFKDASFDAVCCFGALHLFDEPMQALDEIVRVLAPGGRVAILTTTMKDGDHAPKDGSELRMLGGVRIFAREEIPGALRERGLVDVDKRTIGRIDYIEARKP